jgi:phospholipid/cholesterol/gamma-HCH transport system permease protein
MTVLRTNYPRLFREMRRPIGFFGRVGDRTMFYAKGIAGMPHAAIRYRTEVIRLIAEISMGAGTLAMIGGTVAIVGFLTLAAGGTLAVQGYSSLGNIGVEALTGFLAAFINVRISAPVVAGIGLAATFGAGVTAQLGAMRINEEIDALDVMAIRPIPYMVTTRLMASITAIIPLYIVCLGVSYLSTQIIVSIVSGGSMGGYMHYFGLMLSGTEIFYSVVKCVIFVAIAAVLQCYYGFYASGGPEGVGVAAGHAMRAAITVVVIVNMLLTMAMFSLDSGARFGG